MQVLRIYFVGQESIEGVLMKPEESSMSMTLLLETVVLLIDTKLPWVCNIVGYLFTKKDIHSI